MTAEGLIRVIAKEGIELDDPKEVKEQISSAIEDKRFYIFKDKFGREVGFVTWQEKSYGNKLYIFVNNLLVLKDFKGQAHITKFKDFLKEKYPKMAGMYWKNRKHNKIRYFNQGG